MFSLIGAVNNHREARYLRRHRAHYDVIVMGSIRIAIIEGVASSKRGFLNSSDPHLPKPLLIYKIFVAVASKEPFSPWEVGP